MADPITGILKSEANKQQNNALSRLRENQDAMKQAFTQSAAEQMKNIAPQYAPGLQQAMDYASSIGMAGIGGTGVQGLEASRAQFGQQRQGEQNQLNELMNRQMDYKTKALDIESSQADQAIKDQQAIENEVKALVGDDVNAYQSIMQSIGSDPEMAGMHNAASMAARHAARAGIDPQAIKLRNMEKELRLKARFEKSGDSAMDQLTKLMLAQNLKGIGEAQQNMQTTQAQLNALQAVSTPSLPQDTSFIGAISRKMGNVMGIGGGGSDAKKAALISAGVLNPSEATKADSGTVDALFDQTLASLQSKKLSAEQTLRMAPQMISNPMGALSQQAQSIQQPASTGKYQIVSVT